MQLMEKSLSLELEKMTLKMVETVAVCTLNIGLSDQLNRNIANI